MKRRGNLAREECVQGAWESTRRFMRLEPGVKRETGMGRPTGPRQTSKGSQGKLGSLHLILRVQGSRGQRSSRAVPHLARMENEEEIKAEGSQTTRESAKAGGKRMGGEGGVVV